MNNLRGALSAFASLLNSLMEPWPAGIELEEEVGTELLILHSQLAAAGMDFPQELNDKMRLIAEHFLTEDQEPYHDEGVTDFREGDQQ